MKKLACVLALLTIVIYNPNTLLATDLTIGKVEPIPSFYTVGMTLPVVVEVKNINVLDAPSYTVRVLIKSDDNFTMYDQTITGTNLKKFTSAFHTFPSWKPDAAGTFSISAKVTFGDDIDHSNDEKIQSVLISREPLTYLKAVSIAIGTVLDMPVDTALLNLFVPSAPTPAGTRVRSNDSLQFDSVLTKDTWVSWVDLNKFARFSHPTALILQDAYDSTKPPTVHPMTWWPIIGGSMYPADSQYTSNLVLGTEIPTTKEDTNTVHSNNSVSVPADSVCALLFSGDGDHRREHEAFNTDVDLMENNLRLETYGPRLPAGNVRKIKNASYDEITDIINNLNGRYKKIYFFYSGHGSPGYMCTRDSWVSYYDLFSRLIAEGVKDICLVVDACYSGSAIDAAKSVPGYDTTNITIVTASSKDSTSYSHQINLPSGGRFRSGFYTWAFVQCFGNPDADFDKDGHTTIPEAHQWAMSQNPRYYGHKSSGDTSSFTNRLTMDSLMRPQMHVHRAVTPPAVAAPISVPDADATITPSQPLGAKLRVSMNLDDYTYPQVDSIYDFALPRQWSVEGPLGMKYNLELNYRLGVDSVRTTVGYDMGMAYADSGIGNWKPWYPTIHNKSKGSVTAIGIEKLGSWSLATTLVPEIAAVEPIAGSNWLASTFPNPVHDVLRVAFTLEATDIYDLSIFDVLGKTVYRSTPTQLSQGESTLSLDVKAYPQGAYRLVITRTSDGISKAVNFVRQQQ